MTPACAAFRSLLEEALAGPGAALGALETHPHPAACAPCRAELMREQSLERLLGRWPAPVAPAGLADQLLARLAQERRVPKEERESEREDEREDERAPAAGPRLDELLDGLPAPVVPAGLADRVLQGVAPARRSRRFPRGLLAVAAGLAGLALWAWSLRSRGEPAQELRQGPVAELEADAELLAYAVERWELLHDDDLDLWLASLDPVDELLLEYAGEETWLEEGAGPGQPRSGEGF